MPPKRVNQKVGTANRGRKTITTTRNIRPSGAPGSATGTQHKKPSQGKVTAKRATPSHPKKAAPVTKGIGGARKRSRSRSRKVARIGPQIKNAKPVPKESGLKIQTAMRKTKEESKENPQYTQLRTNRPPVCYYAKQGPRDYMEDTYQIMHFDIGGKPGTFYGVFDGHGGKDVSYECVHMNRGIFPFLIESIKRSRGKNIGQVLKSGFIDYDKILFKKGLNAGSTAVVVLHYDGKMWLANLGDSRGMIFTKGSLITVSDDHKPQKPSEKNRIYRAGHFVNPFRIYSERPTGKRFQVGDVYKNADKKVQYIYLHGKWEPLSRDQMTQIEDMTRDAREDTTRVSNSLALSRALGDFYLKTDHQERYMGPQAAISPVPDITEIDLKKYQGQEVYIFLASDGFWDVNRNTAGLRKSIANHPAPQKFCQELVDASYQKGSQDNTTVVLDSVKV